MATKRIKQLVFNGQTYEFNASNVKNYDDTELKNRLSVLEAIDHAGLVKQIDFDNFTSVTDANLSRVNLHINNLKTDVETLKAVDTSKFQTEEQVNTAIQKVVGAAPEALDTLEEIATKLQDNDNVVAAMVTTISGKVDKTDYENFAGFVESNFNDYNTIIGELQNIDHSKFLTEHQDVSMFATKSEVEGAVSNVCEAMTQEEYDALEETTTGKLYLILD